MRSLSRFSFFLDKERPEDAHENKGLGSEFKD